VTAAAAAPGTGIGRHLPLLDLLRFLAAMLVLLYHYGFRGANQGKYLAFGYPEIADIFRFSFVALDFLFVISGFVILMTVEAGQGMAGRFVASRLSRLYPAFLAAAALTLFMVWPHDPPFGLPLRDALWNLTLVPGWFGARAIDGAYWTLGVELQFYIVVTACLLLPRWLRVDWVLMLWSLAQSLFWLWPSVHPLAAFVVMPLWGPYFLAGCVCYRAFRAGWTWWRAAQVVLAAALAIGVSLRQQVTELSNSFALTIPFVPSALMMAAVFAGFAMLCARPRWLERGSEVWIALGAITYPLYLLHQKLGYLTMTALQPHIGRWMALFATVGFVLVLAWSLHRWIERPLNGLLRRWLIPRLRFLDFFKRKPARHSLLAPLAEPSATP
jgi:peptidoglycan/LPS O-acetylase OafA/YrhL